MSEANEKILPGRRRALAGIGALGASVFAGEIVRAAERRSEKSEFDYDFRRFGANEKIRVGMIGSVGHTNLILSGIAKLPNVELAAYSNLGDSQMELPRSLKKYEDYEEMLDKEKLDLVGVCLPYYLNASASIAVAERGIHVITEKPVATNLKDFSKLRKAVVGNRVRLTTLLNMRFEPRFQAIHTAITEGAIGEPILATAQKSYKFGESRPDFYKDVATYGGTIPWVGIHAIDYIHYTTRLDFNAVATFQGNKDHPDYPGCQDYVGSLFTLSNGGTAMVNMDFLRPETAPTHGDDRLRVMGSEGVIEIFDGGTRVELISSSHGPRDLELPDEISLFEDFISELRGESVHILSPEEPFEMTRVALLAHQSGEKGKVIEL